MDTVDAATRSRIMSRIRGRDTKPELQLRSLVFAAGLRFRANRKSVPGTPDLSNASRKLAVFVDGCFWHGCPRHYKEPKSRPEYWRTKIQRNKQRKDEVLVQLADWKVVEIWECELRENPALAAKKVTSAVQSKHFGKRPKHRIADRRNSSVAKQ